MKYLILSLALLISSISFSSGSKDSIMIKFKKPQLYTKIDFNLNPTFEPFSKYHIFNSSIGLGFDYKSLKLELLFPYVNYYDSSLFFKKSYCARIGFNFKPNLYMKIAAVFDFQQFLYSGNETLYDYGSPNVEVPISIDRKMNIKRFSYNLRLVNSIKQKFQLCIDIGFSLFKVKQEVTSLNDGNAYEMYHELINDELDFDAARLNLGISFNYLLN